jgi:hypothetical protein
MRLPFIIPTKLGHHPRSPKSTTSTCSSRCSIKTAANRQMPVLSTTHGSQEFFTTMITVLLIAVHTQLCQAAGGDMQMKLFC